MNYDRYDFLGGENHLRLVLGASGFWYLSDKLGFHFYTSDNVQVEVEFYQNAKCPEIYIFCDISRNGFYNHIGARFIKLYGHHNKALWKKLTHTRLDLL